MGLAGFEILNFESLVFGATTAKAVAGSNSSPGHRWRPVRSLGTSDLQGLRTWTFCCGHQLIPEQLRVYLAAGRQQDAQAEDTSKDKQLGKRLELRPQVCSGGENGGGVRATDAFISMLQTGSRYRRRDAGNRKRKPVTIICPLMEPHHNKEKGGRGCPAGGWSQPLGGWGHPAGGAGPSTQRQMQRKTKGTETLVQLSSPVRKDQDGLTACKSPLVPPWEDMWAWPRPPH